MLTPKAVCVDNVMLYEVVGSVPTTNANMATAQKVLPEFEEKVTCGREGASVE